MWINVRLVKDEKKLFFRGSVAFGCTSLYILEYKNNAINHIDDSQTNSIGGKVCTAPPALYLKERLPVEVSTLKSGANTLATS